MWELDVQLTSDSQLVVMHDDSLQRTSDVAERFPDRAPWRVRDFIMDEVRNLDCGSWYTMVDPFGQIKSGRVTQDMLATYEGESAPTLEEALGFTADHDWRVNVELKDVKHADSGRYLVHEAARCIIASLPTDRVIVSSFNHDYLRLLRDIHPEIPTAALTVWPMRKPVSTLAELGAQAHNPMYSSVRRRTVRQLSKHGYGTNVWTVNRRSAMRRLIRLRVAGIVTDFPQVLDQELRRLASI